MAAVPGLVCRLCRGGIDRTEVLYVQSGGHMEGKNNHSHTAALTYPFCLEQLCVRQTVT